MALLLTACTFGVARADLRIQQVLIVDHPSRSMAIDVRVILTNPGTRVEPGPIRVQLFVRGSASEGWRLLTTMPDIGRIPPGYKIARDYLVNQTGADPVILLNRFQLRVVATAANGQAVATIVNHHTQ
jgi:hypothetical protein